MRIQIVCLLVASLLAHVAAAQTQHAPHPDLVRIAEDMTYTTAKLYPMEATELGIPGHDGELGSPSESARADYVNRLRQWKSRLDAIAAGLSAQTSLADRDDAALLEAQIAARLNRLLIYQFDRKDYSASGNSVVNTIYTQFEHLPVVGHDGASRADLIQAWKDITSRLEAAPDYISAARRLVTQPGHLFGAIGLKQLTGAPVFLNGPLSDAARTQLGEGSADFARFGKGRDAALSAIADLRAFIESHLRGWPENFAMGRDAYNRMLRDELLLPFNAADAVRIGSDELAHGWAEEAWLQDLARRRKTPIGAASGGGMAPQGQALVGYYAQRIAELRKFVSDEGIVTVPSWLGPIAVVETPASSTGVSRGLDEPAAPVRERLFRLLLHHPAEVPR